MTRTGLDALKIIALLAMIWDHAAKTFFAPDTDTLVGRLAFPLFFFAFAWTLPHVIDRPGVLTRRWIVPGVFAQAPFAFLFATHGQPWWTMANMVLVFIALTWLAWAIHRQRIISATLAVPAITAAGWGASYGFVGPLATSLSIGAHAASGAGRAGLAGLAAAMFVWHATETSGLAAALVVALGVPLLIGLAAHIPERGRLMTPGFLAWAYAAHLVVLAASQWACEAILVA